MGEEGAGNSIPKAVGSGKIAGNYATLYNILELKKNKEVGGNQG